MTFQQRRKNWYAAGVSTLLLLSIAATKSVASDCPLTDAKEWVETHADALPKTLAQVTQFPEPYQRVIMRSLPPATQAGIWREHFANTRRNMRLGDEQNRVLMLMDDSLDVWMAAKIPPATLAKGGEVYQLVRATFPDSVSRSIFASLGASGKGTMAIQTASMFSAANSLLTVATVQAGIRAVFGAGSISKALAPVDPCNCSSESTWCSSGAICRTWVSCDVNWGCGTMFIFQCDGKCATP